MHRKKDAKCPVFTKFAYEIVKTGSEIYCKMPK